ncbi:DUF3592 domain-containing protein [Deinococcus sp. NW-56]|uniref:DUF3592 domain-containing protein n=1 Tax=Deinococcus sp. NW-56 TaxID=2080419 RepID=UPI000CF39047
MLARLFWTLFISIFGISTLFTFVSYTVRFFAANSYQSTEGRVLQLDYDPFQGGKRLRDCRLRYVYEVGERTYEGTRDGGAVGIEGLSGANSLCRRRELRQDSPVIDIGSPVEVLYDPDQPQLSMTRAEFPRGILWTVGLVTLFWLGGLYALWVPSARPASPSKEHS